MAMRCVAASFPAIAALLAARPAPGARRRLKKDFGDHPEAERIVEGESLALRAAR